MGVLDSCVRDDLKDKNSLWETWIPSKQFNLVHILNLRVQNKSSKKKLSKTYCVTLRNTNVSNDNRDIYKAPLTGKRVFLTCSCHEICRDEAVGLKSCKYT